jgi:hypothetical protein
VPFQVDPMLIPMFGRGNLSKKFAAGGGAKSGVGTPTSSPDKLEEFNRKCNVNLKKKIVGLRKVVVRVLFCNSSAHARYQ